MTKTKRINLTLPERLADYVQAQVESGNFQREADFIRHAIRKMQENEAVANDLDIDTLVEKGIHGNRSTNSVVDIHKTVQKQLHEAGQ